MPPIFGWPVITPKSSNPEALKYNVSIPSWLFKLIKYLECKRCLPHRVPCSNHPFHQSDRTSDDMSVVIADCGHYIHEKCETAGNKAANIYRCTPNCQTNLRSQTLMANTTVEPFGDFYTTIREPGYKCHDCNELHPKYNSVCYNEDGSDKQYLCVWCVTQKDKYVETKIRRIKWDDPKKSGMVHHSIDIDSTSYKKLLLLQCCICMKSVLEGEGALSHVPCGHIRHDGCYYRETYHQQFVCCNICDAPNEWSIRDVRPSKFRSYVEEYETDKNVTCVFTSRECTDCRQNHAEDNFYKYRDDRLGIIILGDVCVWCTVGERIRKEERKQKK